MLYVPNYQPAPVSYYPEPYPSYYYPTATFFAAAVTGAIWAAAVDWDDWGVWGGGWGGDIDIDCNNCFNNINGKVNWNNVDWRNVDRSKIKFDRNQLANFDRTKIKNSIRADGGNSLRNKATNIRNERAGDLAARAKTGDVRKNALDGQRRNAGDLAGANRPNAGQRPNAGSGQRGQANAGQRPNAGQIKANRPSNVSRPSGKAKAGARVDNRPNKPSGLGNVNRGKTAQISPTVAGSPWAAAPAGGSAQCGPAVAAAVAP